MIFYIKPFGYIIDEGVFHTLKYSQNFRPHIAPVAVQKLISSPSHSGNTSSNAVPGGHPLLVALVSYGMRSTSATYTYVLIARNIQELVRHVPHASSLQLGTRCLDDCIFAIAEIHIYIYLGRARHPPWSAATSGSLLARGGLSKI
jgi:hypothetical protein